jgi:hypothetical protein
MKICHRKRGASFLGGDSIHDFKELMKGCPDIAGNA